MLAPKLADFRGLKRGRNLNSPLFFILSLKVTPFNCDLTKNLKNRTVGTLFLNFLKSAPKSPNFGQKSPIFDRFQKIFFSPSSTFPNILKGIKKIFCSKMYMVRRTKKRFSPILGSENGVRPISAPRGAPGQNFFGHKLGVGRPSKWTISRWNRWFCLRRFWSPDSRTVC